MLQSLILAAALLGQAGPAPAPLQTAVRTRAFTTTSYPNGLRLAQYGSGTIIYSAPDQTVILTCAHAFSAWDKTTPIEVDLFDGVPHGPTEQAEKVQTLKATRLILDNAVDLAILWISPAKPLKASRICSVDYAITAGDPMRVTGCRKTLNPNVFECTVQAPSLPWSDLPGSYRGVMCTAAASDGRSGGGLFNAKGLLCGVLNRCSGFDDGYAGWSLYASPQTIFTFLHKHDMCWLQAGD